MQVKSRYRLAKSRFVYFLASGLAMLAMLPLFLILWDLIVKGYQQFNLDLFTQIAPSSIDAMLAKINGELIPGGILNGIVGTLLIVGIATIIAIPLGILIGTYLAENQNCRYSLFINFMSDLLNSVPSIILGIVVYFWIVIPMHGYSALAGSIALAVMMLPMAIRSTAESLKMLPITLKEAGLALGGSYTSVVVRILLPSAFGGIFTGSLLAVSRVIGETAPLLVTALGAANVNLDYTKPSSAISLLIWEFYNDPNLANLVWAASLLLLLIVLLSNICAKRIAKKWKIQ